MRYALSAAIFMLASCVASFPSNAPTIRMVMASVVQVDVTCEHGQGYGSGSVVACRKVEGGYLISILTAKHVVDHALSVTVRGVAATEISTHPVLDVAIVKVLLNDALRPLDGRPEAVTAGEQIICCGFGGGGGDMWVSTGVASAFDRGGFAAPGDSGGAVTDDSGRLVGVMVSVDALPFIGLVMHHCTFVPFSGIADWVAATS